MTLKNIKQTEDLSDSLKSKGLRSTKQRLCVYDVILEKRDHPTADDIFLRVKKKLPKISFATVYNCLETFVECGLVKKINLDRIRLATALTFLRMHILNVQNQAELLIFQSTKNP